MEVAIVPIDPARIVNCSHCCQIQAPASGRSHKLSAACADSGVHLARLIQQVALRQMSNRTNSEYLANQNFVLSALRWPFHLIPLDGRASVPCQIEIWLGSV